MRESWGPTNPKGAMKVKASRSESLGRILLIASGRTTGPSYSPRGRGGARAYMLGPERW